MTVLINDERFGGAAHGTLVANANLPSGWVTSGTVTATQHATDPSVHGGMTGIAAVGEANFFQFIAQLGTRSLSGIRFVGFVAQPPAATAYVAGERQTAGQTVARQLALFTNMTMQMRDFNTTLVGSAIAVPVGRAFAVQWTADVGNSLQSLTIWDEQALWEKDPRYAIASTSGAYTQGAVDHMRLGIQAGVTGGAHMLYTHVTVTDDLAPYPSFHVGRRRQVAAARAVALR